MLECVCVCVSVCVCVCVSVFEGETGRVDVSVCLSEFIMKMKKPRKWFVSSFLIQTSA